MTNSSLQRTLRRWLRAKHIIIIALCALLTVACSRKDDNPVAPNSVNYDTTTMALIPAGTFRMGNLTNHPVYSTSEKHVHDVTITRPFLMSRTEVTQARYEAVMRTNPSYFKGPDLPVDGVSWYDAVAFCNALSFREGLDSCYSGNGASIVCDFTANGYRLPTEAEWEYACRAGTETDFYSGNITSSFDFDSALDRAGWYRGNSDSTTHPVGEREANAFGLYDMHGNVLEWCWDWYSHGYYATSPTENPRGPTSGTSRVLRGGSWFSIPTYCRSASRNYASEPNGQSSYGGFRVVRTY